MKHIDLLYHIIKSELDNIFGIGEKTKFKLIEKFGSVEKIKKTSLKEIVVLIGDKKGKKVFKYLEKKVNTPIG